MATTPNFQIPLYTTSDTAKLDTLLNGQATALDTNLKAALDANVRKFTSSVASEAERNTLFPSPVQGDRVWRVDKGWEEAYFAAYNATTNPSGTTTAGWYPVAGALPYGSARISTDQTVATGLQTVNIQTAQKITGGFQLTSNALRIPLPGRYRAQGVIYTWTQPGTFRTVAIYQGATRIGGHTQADPWSIGPAIIEFDANAGDLITLRTDGDASIVIRTQTANDIPALAVNYIGPRIGA